ncbi:MAG TPA: metallophosphoesterase [Candidatus Acidoferrales bacterium]|nr:metallophosphoesterase [Candidatus Acidoferrales bacterium]
MPRGGSTVLAQPIFGESNTTPDPTKFTTKHPSDSQVYKEIGDLSKKDVVGFDPSRGEARDLFTLADALGPHGPEMTKAITRAGKIIFHSVGDTGASNQKKYGDEISVADQLTADCHNANQANRPAFLFHLGDVVYNFGESTYYYDQFYDPFRNYPLPIFAIPGNHDSFVVPGTPAGKEPLTTFQRNFCASQPAVTAEAGSLHRTAMTQPGVYFTLDAPFVRIIGLFSNSLEDPGLISSENGKWPGVPDNQLDFLTDQLQRIRSEKYQGAVLLATHHPPFSYSPPPKLPGSGGNHSSSVDMLREIDGICKKVGVYPHAFLSGHAHNYQRFVRQITFGGKACEVPFIVCGDGGHNVNRLVRAKKGQAPQEPPFGISTSYLDFKPAVSAQDLILKHYDDTNYGYLRIRVDKKKIAIEFHQIGQSSLFQSRVDMVTVELASHKVVGN